jgi:succinyl-diaminopimelate desuccinylase
MSATLRLAEELISRASVTPLDEGCQALITHRLAPLGFVCETIRSGPADALVTNLWARRPGALDRAGEPMKGNTLVFAGHTDVVPTGPLDQWSSPPFVPSHREGKLYGRGATDMKSSLAAMVVAVEEYLAAHPDPAHSIGFLLTSDEEGPSVDGTAVVCQQLTARGERLDWCIVGEPTSVQQCGDMIKNGRRGSLSGKLRVKGVQCHIAYPQLGRNPVHALAPALAELVATEWDQGNAFFDPTSWQISNVHAGTGAANIIPGHLELDFNFRFCTESTPESLQQRVEAVLHSHRLDFELRWTLGGRPFITTPGPLVRALEQAITEHTGITTELSTSGGTSDARFISAICAQVVEFGPTNASIHKIDEHIDLRELEPLKNIYRGVLERLVT